MSGGEGIRKHKWKWAAAFALTVLVGIYLVREARQQGFHWSVFVSTLASLRWQWLLLATVFVGFSYYGRVLRWAVLMRPVRPHPGMWNLFSSTVIGFTAVTLLGRAGEFVRPYLISVKERVPFSSQLAAWLLERICDLLVALLVFGFALTKVHSSGVTVGPALSWILTFGGRIVGLTCLACLVVLVIMRHFSETARRRLLAALKFLPEHHYGKMEKLVNAFVQGVESTRDLTALLLLTLYSILDWVVIAACYLCITRAFGSIVHFGWIDILIFMGFVSFGAVVQVPGIGGGVQVVSVLVLTELFGLPLEVATSLSLVTWLITFVVVVPAGVLLGLHDGLNWKKLKEVGQEVAP